MYGWKKSSVDRVLSGNTKNADEEKKPSAASLPREISKCKTKYSSITFIEEPNTLAKDLNQPILLF